jgi:gliding-associated putative ABC transporter substrate-binding component GldG
VISSLLGLRGVKFDLTAEKRHSLTAATIAMLDTLPDDMYVRCYLHGEFPAGYKHLEQSIKERLQEFRDYSHERIDYEFIDPYESGDNKTIKEVFKALDEKGLKFSNISFEEEGVQATKLIWPCAIIEYHGKEYPIQFLKSEAPAMSDEMIAASVNHLEYELSNSIRKITRTEKPAVALLSGHRELDPLHLADFIYGMRENYDVELVRIDSQLNALSEKIAGLPDRRNLYSAMIIAGPDSLVSDRDRFIIDQFIMNGGKVLWMLDALKINMDSLRREESVMAASNENGLYEMLFEYGVRLNRALVIDYQSAPIILDHGPMGNQRNYVDRNNYYSPLFLSNTQKHPITANLDPLKMEFAGSLDSVNQNPEVLKIPLLRSSKLSKELRAPVRVDLGLLEMSQDYFASNNQPERVMAMILEGKFPSAFKDQTPLQIKQNESIAFKEKSKTTRMIVIADGDMAYNDVDFRGNRPMPLALGYDPQFRRVLYDNKEFLLNCMNYLMDDQALITVRSRAIELRKLNMAAVEKDHTNIVLVNAVFPVLLVMGFGMLRIRLRKRKWARKQ